MYSSFITIITILFQAFKALGIGLLIGSLVSIYTLGLIYCLSERTKRYRPTYIPITFVKAQLIEWIVFSYPLLFGVGYLIIHFLKW